MSGKWDLKKILYWLIAYPPDWPSFPLAYSLTALPCAATFATFIVAIHSLFNGVDMFPLTSVHCSSNLGKWMLNLYQKMWTLYSPLCYWSMIAASLCIFSFIRSIRVQVILYFRGLLTVGFPRSKDLQSTYLQKKTTFNEAAISPARY